MVNRKNPKTKRTASAANAEKRVAKVQPALGEKELNKVVGGMNKSDLIEK